MSGKKAYGGGVRQSNAGANRMDAGERIECRSRFRANPAMADFYCTCGLNRQADEKKIYVTALHPSVFPAETNCTLVMSQEMAREAEKQYPFLWCDAFNINVEVHKNTIAVPAVIYDSAARKYCIIKVWAFDLRDRMLIPDSIPARRLLKEARMRGLTPILVRQAPINQFDSVLTHRDVPDGFFADTWSVHQYAPNVIPKAIPSLLDVKMRLAENPFTNRADKAGGGK